MLTDNKRYKSPLAGGRVLPDAIPNTRHLEPVPVQKAWKDTDFFHMDDDLSDHNEPVSQGGPQETASTRAQETAMPPYRCRSKTSAQLEAIGRDVEIFKPKDAVVIGDAELLSRDEARERQGSSDVYDWMNSKQLQSCEETTSLASTSSLDRAATEDDTDKKPGAKVKRPQALSAPASIFIVDRDAADSDDISFARSESQETAGTVKAKRPQALSGGKECPSELRFEKAKSQDWRTSSSTEGEKATTPSSSMKRVQSMMHPPLTPGQDDMLDHPEIMRRINSEDSMQQMRDAGRNRPPPLTGLRSAAKPPKPGGCFSTKKQKQQNEVMLD
jgi:hypothetical protein